MIYKLMQAEFCIAVPSPLKMWCKVFLVALLAVTLVQSHVPQSSQDELITYEEVEKLKGAFDKLKELIERAIRKAEILFNQLKDSLERHTAEIIGNLKNQLQVEVNKLLGQVKILEDKARRQGVDINICVKDRKQTIIDFPNTLGREIVQCGYDEVNKGLRIIEDGKNEVRKSVREINSLTNEYSHCGRLPWYKRGFCYTKVTAEITKAAATIPSTLVKYEGKANRYVQHISQDLRACGLGKIQQADARGAALIDEIAKCIDSRTNLNDIN